MVAQWAKQYPLQIKGALLVAPADADAATFPEGAGGFKPVPLIKLPFPSIVVASANDHFADIDRSLQFANAWGSSFINVGNAGHINVASGYGEWDAGLPFLKQLDQVK